MQVITVLYSANAMLILMASNPLAHFVYINGVHIKLALHGVAVVE